MTLYFLSLIEMHVMQHCCFGNTTQLGWLILVKWEIQLFPRAEGCWILFCFILDSGIFIGASKGSNYLLLDCFGQMNMISFKFLEVGHKILANLSFYIACLFLLMLKLTQNWLLNIFIGDTQDFWGKGSAQQILYVLNEKRWCWKACHCLHRYVAWLKTSFQLFWNATAHKICTFCYLYFHHRHPPES